MKSRYDLPPLQLCPSPYRLVFPDANASGAQGNRIGGAQPGEDEQSGDASGGVPGSTPGGAGSAVWPNKPSMSRVPLPVRSGIPPRPAAGLPFCANSASTTGGAGAGGGTGVAGSAVAIAKQPKGPLTLSIPTIAIVAATPLMIVGRCRPPTTLAVPFTCRPLRPR